MGNNHEGCRRGFFRAGLKWLSASETAGLAIGFYDPRGVTISEFTMTWWRWSGNHNSPEIRVFSDAWSALYGFSDFLAKLAKHDGEDLSPDAVVVLLRECGVADLTEEDWNE